MIVGIKNFNLAWMKKITVIAFCFSRSLSYDDGVHVGPTVAIRGQGIPTIVYITNPPILLGYGKPLCLVSISGR